MNEEAIIWYQLVKKNGDKLGSCTSVDVPKNSNIDKFRKLVKLENSTKLSHCDASDLVVYENRAAFEIQNIEERFPLEVDLPLAGLGADVENALWVEVPDHVGFIEIDFSWNYRQGQTCNCAIHK